MNCPIHHQMQQQTKIAESKEELSYLAQKYKAKKKAYKESLKKLRNELKELREEQYNQQMNMNSLRNQYENDFNKVQYLKNMIPNRVQMPNTLEEFREEESSQFEVIRKQKQYIEELCQENDNLKNSNYQLHIDNAKLNALLHGKNQECQALIEELGYLSQHRY